MLVTESSDNRRKNRILSIVLGGTLAVGAAALYSHSIGRAIHQAIGWLTCPVCSPGKQGSSTEQSFTRSTTGERFLRVTAHRDSLAFDPSAVTFEEWIRFYDPQRACNGYTLAFYQRRVPILIDMNGEVVHAWPNVLGRGRMRLSPNGNLLLIGADNLIREFDWNGKLLWQHAKYSADDFPHHDLRYAAKGRVFSVFRDMETGGDYIAEIDTQGTIHWRWDSIEYLDHSRAPVDSRSLDNSHINSVQEIPPNRWFESGDDRFRPGNLLVSAREWNAVFVIDRFTGEIVWEYSGELDGQHEALMIEKGLLGEGNVIVFDNGKDNLYRYKRSLIIEIDPTTNSMVWEYSSPDFYSSLHGSQQMLPNGNVMISSALGGRVFEVERDGAIVWEWTPPFEPRRPHRYPYDYCPQFEALDPPEERPILPDTLEPHVDAELYVFDLDVGDVIEFNTAETTFGFRCRTGLPEPVCRTVVVPPRAELTIGFGMYGTDLSTAISAGENVSFIVEIQSMCGQRRDRLVDHSFAPSAGSTWIRETVPLEEFACESVRLCLVADSADKGDSNESIRRIHWSRPTISRVVRVPRSLHSIPDDPRIVSKHLQALGYAE